MMGPLSFPQHWSPVGPALGTQKAALSCDTSSGRKDGAEPGVGWTGVGEASSTDVRKGVHRQRGHEEARGQGQEARG